MGRWLLRSGPTSLWFWRVLRAAQVAIVVDVVLGGVLMLIGRKAPSLHFIYGVLPVLVSLLAEQFRISAAQMVLDSRGFENAAAVGRLPRRAAASSCAIVRMEVGVMALSAFVMSCC